MGSPKRMRPTCEGLRGFPLYPTASGRRRTNPFSASSFTGTLDPPLTDRGVHEAREIGRHLHKLSLPPIDHAFSSPLQRAAHSLDHIFETYYDQQQDLPPRSISPELNERDYGDLNGRDKAKTAEEFGAEQVNAWRRSFRAVPPGGESLEMTVDRVWAYYVREIQPRLARGECVLVVSHGNTLRGLCMKLDELDADQVLKLTLGTGALRIYRIDKVGHVTDRQLFAVDGLEGGRQ